MEYTCKEKREREEIEKRNIRDTLKLRLQHRLYYLKDLDKTNSITLTKVTNDDPSVYHLSLKASESSIIFGRQV
jgi:hypothetical protein